VFDGRKSRPIPDAKVFDFISGHIHSGWLYNKTIISDFLDTYYAWLQTSRLNTVHGLDKFNKLGFVHGTSQAFDFFYAENRERRMRCFRGDFIYHELSWRNNYPGWSYIEDDDIRRRSSYSCGDAVVISLPFSDYGAEHPDMQDVLDSCDEQCVPVFIDCAYYSMARGLDFHLDRDCIQGISFSMSKGFYGAERLRIGMRCKRTHNDDPVDLFTGMGMLSKISPGVGRELCQSFDADYTNDKYRQSQEDICKSLKIEPSDCVSFGITDKTHKEFGSYNRGTEWRRVCISKLMSDMGDEYE